MKHALTRGLAVAIGLVLVAAFALACADACEGDAGEGAQLTRSTTA